MPVEHERLDRFEVSLPAARAGRLRALADHEGALAVDLIRQWIFERLDQSDIPQSPRGGPHYPPNVIPFPHVH